MSKLVTITQHSCNESGEEFSINVEFVSREIVEKIQDVAMPKPTVVNMAATPVVHSKLHELTYTNQQALIGAAKLYYLYAPDGKACNKIEAILHIRSITLSMLGLKDAKDLVEYAIDKDSISAYNTPHWVKSKSNPS